jgi:phosphoglycolate phosphatase
MADNTRLYSDVPILFEILTKRSINIGIVTSKYRYRIEEILRRENLAEKVNVIIGHEDVKSPKPDPEGLFIAIKRMNLHPNDVLYVGDSIVDAKTAKQGKTHFAVILSGVTKREEFNEYPFESIFNNISELISWIK